MISRINHKVSILCRGSSLKYINKMNVCDTVLLVNSFHKELEEEDISNYVKKHPEVIHFVSPQSEFYSMVELEVYKDYNFTKLVLPYVKECIPEGIQLNRNLYIPSHWKEGEDGRQIRTQFKTISSQEYAFGKPIEDSVLVEIRDKNGDFLPLEHMSEENKKDMTKTKRYPFTSPTCGMDAVLYSVNDLKAKEINIIGLDFYDGVGYLTGSHGETSASSEEAISRGEDSEMMISFLIDFVKKYSDINFNIITKSKLIQFKTSGIKNLNITTV